MSKRFPVVCVLAAVALAAVVVESVRSAAPRVDPLRDLLGRVTVQAPRSYRSLVIYPVTIDRPRDLGRILTLKEALDTGLLSVIEVGEGSVNEALVRNKGGRPVFIMAGDGIKGAKQDRISAADVLVPPERKITIAVYCVEEGRWHGPTMAFSMAPAAAPPLLRSAARSTKDQATVWAENEEFQLHASVASPSKTLNDVYESPKVQAQSKPYLEHFEKIPNLHPRTCGVVVKTDQGRILCADLFYSPDLFQREWPKLLKSYVADVISRPKEVKHITGPSARAFLEQALACRRSEQDTPGDGQVFDLRGDRAFGSTLIYRRAVVHLELFPALARPVPVPLEEDNSLRYRRDRLQQQPR